MQPTSMRGDGGASGAAVSGGSGAPATAGRPAPAGSGGSVAAVGGSGGATATGGAAAPGGAFIREADPTEESVRKNGEYSVKDYNGTMGLRDGPDFGPLGALDGGGTVYYPEDAKPPFGGVVIVPGFTAYQSDIAYWAPFLASHGIVVMTIDTITTGDQPPARSAALLDALVSLKEENTRSGSPLEGKLDLDRLGVMGWSMGGGGTWITADSHPELKIAISLCGWLVGFAGGETKVPSLQLATQFDSLAAGMSQPIYNAIPAGTPKMLIEMADGTHWNSNNPANSDGQIGKYGLSWIKVYLEGDDRYRKFLDTMPEGTSDFQKSL